MPSWPANTSWPSKSSWPTGTSWPAGTSWPTGTPATTVSITAPAASGVVYPTVPVSLVAAVNGSGTVEFFLGAVSLGTAAAAGGLAILSWTPLYTQWGAGNLTAAVNSVTSAAVAITVGPTTALGVYVALASYMTENDGTTPEDTDGIATWNSATGSNNGSQGTAGNRPTWLAAPAEFNTNPAAAFASASSQRMNVDGLAASFVGTATISHNIVALLSPTTLAANMSFFSVAQSAGANGNLRWLLTTAGNPRLSITDDAAVTRISGSASLPTGLVVTTGQQLTVGFDATTRVASAWKAGAGFAAGALGSLGTVTPNDGTIGMHRPVTPAEPFNGRIEEIWVLTGSGSVTASAVPREAIESLQLAKMGSTAPGVGEFDTSAYSLHNWSASGRYRCAAIGSIPASVGVVWRISTTSAASRVLLSAYQTDGWEFVLTTGNTLQVTGPTGVSAAVAVDANIHGLIWTQDGAGNHTLYLDRGIGTVFAGAGVLTGSHELVVGSRSESYALPADNLFVYGFSLSTSAVQSQSDADAWFDECKAAQFCASLTTGATQTLDAKAQMSNLVPDATWAAAVGTSMVRYGTVSVRETSAANLAWGWT